MRYSVSARLESQARSDPPGPGQGTPSPLSAGRPGHIFGWPTGSGCRHASLKFPDRNGGRGQQGMGVG